MEQQTKMKYISLVTLTVQNAALGKFSLIKTNSLFKLGIINRSYFLLTTSLNVYTFIF